MKIKKITTRKPWTKQNNIDVIKLYNEMIALQVNGEKFNKAAMIRKLIEKQERTKGSIECKLMNISAIRQNLLSLDIVKGFKALDNYNHDLAELVCADFDVEYKR